MISEQTIYPRKWPALVPAVLALVIFAFFSPQQNDHSIAYVSGFLLLISIIGYFLISSASISFTESGLVHKTFFRTSEVFWNNLSKTYIKYCWHGKSGSHYWFFEDRNDNATRFPLRLYSRSSLQTLARVVVSKCPSAIADERIGRMGQGVFPWYIF